MFQSFTEFSPGFENHKSSPEDSKFFNFAHYTEIIDKSAAKQLSTPCKSKANEIFALFDDGTEFLNTVANSFSGNLNEQLDLPTAYASQKKVETLVTIKSEPDVACIRCKTFKNVEEESKGSSAVNFFCDCGMRAVMRKLRNEILSDLNVSKKLMDSSDERDRQLFEESLVEWFEVKLVGLDKRSYFADADRPHCIAMANFLLAHNRQLPVKRLSQNSGCKGKRSAKQNSKDNGMMSVSKPTKHGSPFDYFNRRIFECV